MTAEVAVLNRNAVALAADSAVTLRLPEGIKIYYTNKLFALSKYQPVAVMLYGTADFLGVPWETIIKAYRAQLGRRTFPSVEAYGSDFLNFVKTNSGFFPRDLQEHSCYWWTRGWLRRLKKHWKEALEEKLQKQNTVKTAEAKALFRTVVATEKAHLRHHKVLPCLRGLKLTAFRRSYTSSVKRALADELQKLSDAVSLSQIVPVLLTAMKADAYWHGESGIVVAGFGSEQFFPSLRSYQVDALVSGRLRFEEDKRRADIDTKHTASVIAFAQSEMVSLFMNGIDDDYAGFVQTFVKHSLLSRYPDLVLKLIDKHVTKQNRSALFKKLSTIGGKISTGLETLMTAYSYQTHSLPIVEIVAHLPKEELAAMSEALVNLTSFKRHVTGQADTVGGPIDVAMISKGDGLIWIKRKHYFEPKLNPQFFSNYYRDTERGRTREG